MNHIKANLNEHHAPFPIAIVVSQFNRDITQALEDGALQRLAEYGFSSDHLTVVEVPGAVEIPLTAKYLAKKKHYGAIIALGAVIRGETSHYDYVCEQVSQGCQQIALEFEVPVVFGILTTENEAQAWDRLGGQHGHKGVDSADCALAMHAILKRILS